MHSFMLYTLQSAYVYASIVFAIRHDHVRGCLARRPLMCPERLRLPFFYSSLPCPLLLPRRIANSLSAVGYLIFELDVGVSVLANVSAPIRAA